MGTERLIHTVENIEATVRASTSTTRVLVATGSAISSASVVRGWYGDVAVGAAIAGAGLVREVIRRRRNNHRA